jgi:CheY-like chemotaxis protein
MKIWALMAQTELYIKIILIANWNKIKTGQMLRVDGNTGTVHVLDLLSGKKVLVVDDELDVLETLEELLWMCDVVKVSSFDEAKKLLQTQYFDIAILDIMGVKGYKLLSIANERKVIAVMLTAHALSIDDTVRSFKGGAASYVPKEEMANIAVYLDDILDAKEKGKEFWRRWFERFEPYYDKKFGPGWKNKHKEFWEELESGE